MKDQSIPVIWSQGVSGAEYNRLTSSFLYAWLRNDVVLYIGQSRNGFSRFFNHHVIGSLDVVLPDDQFFFMHMAPEKLYEQERIWIKYYKPKYNLTHNPKPTRQKKTKVNISHALRALLQEIVFDENSTPEQVISAAANLQGKQPKFLGKYCAYDCRCKDCERYRAAAMR